MFKGNYTDIPQVYTNISTYDKLIKPCNEEMVERSRLAYKFLTGI